MSKKITIEKRKEIVVKSAKNNEILVEYNQNSCLFLDPEYGEFKCHYNNFIKGKSCHPKRRNIHNKIVFEEAVKKLNQKFNYLTIIEYGGSSTALTKFLDKDYGEFYSTLHNVLLGRKNHPKRTSDNKSIASIAKWQDEDYKNKQKNGYKKINWDEVNKKRKQTFLEKYGVDCALKNKEFLSKAQSTMCEKYGSNSYAQSDECKNKIKQKLILTGGLQLFNGKSMKEISKELGKAYTTFQSQVKKYGYDIAIKIEKNKKTSIEMIISDMLNNLNCSVKEQFIIENKRSDFTINDNLVIECDGVIWHSDLYLKDKKYHSEKRKVYEKNGYRSFFFRSDEILKNKNIILSIIKNYLKLNVKFYARKCIIKNVDKLSAKDFFNKNHLMGCGQGKTCGLYYDDNPLAMMQIKNKKNGCEISRFCTESGTTIVGGFTKLLNYFVKEKNYKFVMTFIDLRYGSGEYLTKLGFIKTSEHLSFKWTNGNKTFHRMNYPNNSGYEHGLFKIWDCGQRKYVKTI